MPKRPVRTDDIFRFKLLSDPQISPDGKLIAFVQTETDLDKNTTRSHIWLVPSDGSAPPRRFTGGDAKDRAPRWSPDSRQLAFISNRAKQDQLYLIALDGGEARSLTTGEGKPSAAVWSPDGTMIAYTAKVISDAVRHANGARVDSDVRSYTRLNYRSDADGYWDYGWRQVFALAVDCEDDGVLETGVVANAPTGHRERRDARQNTRPDGPMQLTRGNYNYADPAWSPDGKTLLCSANRTANADLSNVSDIWAMNVEAAGRRGRARQNPSAPRALTRSKGPAVGPAFSPDGEWIAFVGHDNRYTRNVTHSRVYVRARDGSQVRCLTETFDEGVGDEILSDLRAGARAVTLQWSADGERIFFIATEHGASNVYQVKVSTGTVTPATQGTHQVFGWSYAQESEQLAYVCSNPANPNDIYTQAAGARSAQRVTHVNAEVMKEVTLSQPSPVSFRSAEGMDVHGWVMKPIGFKTGQQYPTILSIHGGPHSAYGATYFHEFQLLCAAGYGVLYTNPRGSDSYGQDFVKATYKDWGGGDYRDLMTAMDGSLKKFKWMDPQKLGVMGGSYGGYMTGWIITHGNQFKVAIAERMLSNWHSFFGTSDIGSVFGTDWEIGGQPWSNTEGYIQHSPIAHVANCKTPTLILHSENDYRTPIEQGEQFYIALRNLGVPAQLVRFPNESHDLSRGGQPKHRKERYERILEWLGKYL
jgi:dipeptidyl aminopeptidase/acylaminoacyl peptidase